MVIVLHVFLTQTTDKESTSSVTEMMETMGRMMDSLMRVSVDYCDVEGLTKLRLYMYCREFYFRALWNILLVLIFYSAYKFQV